MRDETMWLMDEGFEASAPDGALFGSRLLCPGPFHMTTGAVAPMSPDVLWAAIGSRPAWRKAPPRRTIDDRRFPEAVFAAVYPPEGRIPSFREIMRYLNAHPEVSLLNAEAQEKYELNHAGRDKPIRLNRRV